MKAIRTVHYEIGQQVQPNYQTFQSGYVNFTEGLRNTLGFCHFATQDKRFAPELFIRVVGDEIAVDVDGQTVHRTDVEAPDFGDEFTSIIRNILLKGLRNLIETPSV
jgi:hypothetical protein